MRESSRPVTFQAQGFHSSSLWLSEGWKPGGAGLAGNSGKESIWSGGFWLPAGSPSHSGATQRFALVP